MKKAVSKYVSSPYDAKKHPEQIIDLLKEGLPVAGFCAANNITRATFYNWINTHEEFRQAYNMGVEHAELWLTKQGILGMIGGIKDFNATVWSMLMRNRCKLSEHRTVALDFASCSTSMDKVKLLDREISAGTLTTQEARNFAEYIKACADVNEKTEVAKRVDELMKLAGKA